MTNLFDPFVEALVKNRANHTGTQSADTITDGTTNKAYAATERALLSAMAAGLLAATSTTATGGTTALTAASNPIQILNGTSGQTFTLPTTGIVMGQKYTFINNTNSGLQVNASDNVGVVTLPAGYSAEIVAMITTPTTGGHWRTFFGLSVGVSSGYTAGTVALRNSNANLLANSFLALTTSTATAGGTTTLNAASSEIQIFTGTTTQTVVLPTTSILAGQKYRIINLSTGSVTVVASDASAMTIVSPNQNSIVTAVQATPVSNAHWVIEGNFLNAGFLIATAASTNSVPRRDANANLAVNALLSAATSAATANSTLAMTVASNEIQVFTGSTSTQVVQLPTTSVPIGMRFTIVNLSSVYINVNASGGSLLTPLPNNQIVTVVANQATPTLPAHWSFSPVADPLATAGTVVQRTGSGNIAANAILPNFRAVATSGGTTTLTVQDAQTQNFTGATTHTVVLPTTSVVAGREYKIINTSTGAVTINASAGGLLLTLAAGAETEVTALVATPTLPAHWFASTA
jgi:hypothetical protein